MKLTGVCISVLRKKRLKKKKKEKKDWKKIYQNADSGYV